MNFNLNVSSLTILWPAVSIWVVFKGTKQEKMAVVAIWLLDLLYPLLIWLASSVGLPTSTLIFTVPSFTYLIQTAGLVYLTFSFYKRQEKQYWLGISAIGALVHAYLAINAILVLLRGL